MVQIQTHQHLLQVWAAKTGLEYLCLHEEDFESPVFASLLTQPREARYDHLGEPQCRGWRKLS
jgi:hypothetical protein